MATLEIDKLELSDDDTEGLWASPSRIATKHPVKTNTKAVDGVNKSASIPGESLYDAEQAREEALKKELQGVRSINEVIEGVISSLERAKGNMGNVSRTVTSASTLLNTWTRILSQTEHNQRLILSPSWQGATQDMQDMENETVMKAQAQERKAAEEERRRDEARRRTEEEERQRQAGTSSRGTRGARGRGRGLGRGLSGSIPNSGYVRVGGQGGEGGASRGASQTTGRAGSGIGRGTVGTRGRGKGVR